MEVWPCTAWEKCGGGWSWGVSNISSCILFPVFALLEQGCNWEIRGLVGCWCWTKAGWLESHGWLHRHTSGGRWHCTNQLIHTLCVYVRWSGRERDKENKIHQHTHTVCLCEGHNKRSHKIWDLERNLNLDKQGNVHCKIYTMVQATCADKGRKHIKPFFHHFHPVSPCSALVPQLTVESLLLKFVRTGGKKVYWKLMSVDDPNLKETLLKSSITWEGPCRE